MRKLTSLFMVLVLVFCCAGALAEDGWKAAGAFSEGLAAVQDENGLWGYMNKAGEIVIPCQWDEAEKFSGGIAVVTKDRKYGIINTAGELVSPCEWRTHSNFSEGLIAVKNGEGLWGFLDAGGKLVIPCEWENSIPYPTFHEGFAAVTKDGKMGYIDKTGALVIPCEYSFADPFSCGYAVVYTDEGLLFINQAGEPAFPDLPLVKEADGFREDGIAHLGLSDGSSIYIGTDGKEICRVASEYKFRSNYREGRAGVGTKNGDGEWRDGYIDRTGNVIIPCELFSSQKQFMNGRVSVPDGQYTMNSTVHFAVIDTEGNLVYPYVLDEWVTFEETVAAALQDGKAGAIGVDGSVIVPFEYETTAVGDGVVTCLKDGKIELFDYSGAALN